jgi:hypothetical protein
MGQYNSTHDCTETDTRVVVGLRPGSFTPAGSGCTGKSRGRERDNFRDDPGLDTIPQQLVDRLSLEDWLGFVKSIRALDDSVGPKNKCVQWFMFVPLIGTHIILWPCTLLNWKPALDHGMEEICNDYSVRWKKENLRVTRVHKREGKGAGIYCIRIDK